MEFFFYWATWWFLDARIGWWWQKLKPPSHVAFHPTPQFRSTTAHTPTRPTQPTRPRIARATWATWKTRRPSYAALVSTMWRITRQRASAWPPSTLPPRWTPQGSCSFPGCATSLRICVGSALPSLWPKRPLCPFVSVPLPSPSTLSFRSSCGVVCILIPFFLLPSIDLFEWSRLCRISSASSLSVPWNLPPSLGSLSIMAKMTAVPICECTLPPQTIHPQRFHSPYDVMLFWSDFNFSSRSISLSGC